MVPTFNPQHLPMNMRNRIEISDHGCWVWLGCLNGKGYGNAASDRLVKLTHRIAYEALVGAIPEGLQIDHLCRVRACCNPAHLEPVTGRENIRRSPYFRKSHCLRGHEMTEANTIIKRRDQKVMWNCRVCNNQAQRDGRAKRAVNVQ